MRISVYATPDSIMERDLKEQAVVVIDVLRATSTMITALYNGCKEVIPVKEIEEAINMSKNYDKDAYLLCGERNSQPIEGFHLSNSPLEYKRETVEGKTILFTTTNGTRAMKMTSDAKSVIVCGMINVDAVAEYILASGCDTVFVCAGTEGRFSLDDCITAGAVINRIKMRTDVDMDDLARVAADIYDNASGRIHEALKDTVHYKKLAALGLTADLEYCLTENAAPVIGLYQDGVVKLLDKVR
ncbi:MAG TPA: 2-phosphosulfolactate phosphatase [Candidatus Atribacteria bacterium]|nr:2-phosphosulfolactate phosphatase [Candidatus Atribacteria bacterium]